MGPMEIPVSCSPLHWCHWIECVSDEYYIQRAVTPCGCEYMQVWFVCRWHIKLWSHCYTRAISGCFTDKDLVMKRSINSSVYFTSLVQRWYGGDGVWTPSQLSRWTARQSHSRHHQASPRHKLHILRHWNYFRGNLTLWAPWPISCQVVACTRPRPDRWLVAAQCQFRWQLMPISMLVWVRSFEPDVLKTVYRSTMPLRFIWSICFGN